MSHRALYRFDIANLNGVHVESFNGPSVRNYKQKSSNSLICSKIEMESNAIIKWWCIKFSRDFLEFW